MIQTGNSTGSPAISVIWTLTCTLRAFPGTYSAGAGLGFQIFQAFGGQGPGIFFGAGEFFDNRIFQIDFVRRNGRCEIERANSLSFGGRQRSAGPDQYARIAAVMFAA